jgi:coenzyme F420-reducing hydrogenase gamma subunit
MAVWKFASCDGCQLSLLDCEDELLQVAELVELAYFKEATSTALRGPYDLSLVDGSIATRADVERIRTVRRVSRRVVPIGTCATSGGVQALRNFAAVERLLSIVYPRPGSVDALPTSTPISAHVPVDFELQGCPVNKRQLLEVIGAFLHGRPPAVAANSVCVECKSRLQVCVMVAHGTPCMGPVTHAGCGALCPGRHRGCYGCYGPMEAPIDAPSLSRAFAGLGLDEAALKRSFRNFYAGAPLFRAEGDAHEREE